VWFTHLFSPRVARFPPFPRAPVFSLDLGIPESFEVTGETKRDDAGAPLPGHSKTTENTPEKRHNDLTGHGKAPDE